MVVAIAVALLGALTFLLAQGTLDDESLPDEVRITEVPEAYRIVYEVRQAAGPDGGETVTTEIVQVERPFRSLVTSRVDGELVAGHISDLNRLLQHTDGRWSELQIPPAMAASDLRLDRVLDDLVAAGDVERIDEVRELAGRACQVHRLGGPVGGGTLVPVGEVVGEHADVCVDRAGLVLLEDWQKDGELLRRRTAVDVDVAPDFDEDTFTVDEAEQIPATDGGGSATRVANDATFGDRTLALDAPDGFDLLGRWSIVWPRLETQVDPLADPTAGRVAGIATVWVDGAELLVLEQGGSNDGTRPFQPNPEGERIDLGPLDIGEIVTDGRGTEIRVAYTDGAFVRLFGTLPRHAMVDLARTLRPQ